MGEEKHDKWWYIKQISAASSKYGDKLLKLMDINQVTNLQAISLEQAKEFYEKFVLNS